MSSFMASSETCWSEEINPSGAPLSRSDFMTISTVRCVHFAAPGCGANTTALPPAIMQIVLLMTDATGFVEGQIEAMTPKGAISSSTRPLSPDTACVVKNSGPGVFSIATLFFRTLSSNRPIPVSSQAIFASSSTCGRRSWRSLVMTAVLAAMLKSLCHIA